ncbi:MAG: hypothetical protein PVJ56_13130 [Desulfobacterales bacterium]|jgi:hypothetical protein
MDSTVVLTGILPAVMLTSAGLTAVVSIFLLWLYRKAVLRSMRATTGSIDIGIPSNEAATRSTGNAPDLTIATIEVKRLPDKSLAAAAAFRQATQSLRRSTLIYAVGGLLYALVFAFAWIAVSKGGFIPVRFFWLLTCYSWPVVLTIGLLLAISRRQWFTLVGVYVVALMLIAALALTRNPDLSMGQLAFFWAYANGPATVLLFTFLNRRVRAVGPLVLVFMVAGVTGAVLAIQVVGSNDGLLRAVVALGSAIGLGARVLYVLLHLVGFMVLGFLGWFLLRWIGWRYQLKRFSDQSLTMDAMWLLFGILQSITLVFEGWIWIFSGIVAFAIYRLAVRIGFARLARQSGDDSEPHSLLLLRVFSLGKRSEKLFNMLVKLWLRVGNLSLIAGPDLVTTTVEPHEFLAFLGNRLSRQFVKGDEDLQSRLSRIDRKPDPDGRHRVNEFFCYTDTWQSTMTQLAAQSNVVLMDLRSFSASNQGCLYELQQLLGCVPLERILLVIDKTTDQVFLKKTLHRLWENVDATSPNLRATSPKVRLYEVTSQSAAEIRNLLILLLGAR